MQHGRCDPRAVPEMDALDKMEFYDLMRQVFRLPEVQKLHRTDNEDLIGAPIIFM